MSYTLTKTDGSILAVVQDTMLDTLSCSLTLIGKNAVNFGLAVDENFVGLLQNWANPTAPARPITGQIWYNSSTGDLSYYNGATWKDFSKQDKTNTGDYIQEIGISTPVLISMAGGNLITLTTNQGFDPWTLDTNLRVGSQNINLQKLFPNGLVPGINMPTDTDNGLNLYGTAQYANVLVNSPNIYIGGALYGSATFNGTDDIDIKTTWSNVYINSSSVTIKGSYSNIYVNGAGQVTAYGNLTSQDITLALGYVPYNSSLITSQQFSNTVIARDANGNFDVNQIVADTFWTLQMADDTAIALGGAVSSTSNAFDGIANVILETSLPLQSNLIAGVYNSVTVDKHGLVKAGNYYSKLPLYSIIYYGEVSIPTGWAICDGQDVETPSGQIVTTPNLSAYTFGGLEYIMKCWLDTDLPENSPAIATISVDLQGGGTPTIIFEGGPEPDYPPLIFSQDINVTVSSNQFYTIESANVRIRGTNFKVGDVLTFPGDNGSEPARVTVTGISNGGIASIQINSGGKYPLTQSWTGLVPQWASNAAIQATQAISSKRYRSRADQNKVNKQTGNVTSTGNVASGTGYTNQRLDLRKVTLPVNVQTAPNFQYTSQTVLDNYAVQFSFAVANAPIDQNAVRLNSSGTVDQSHLPIYQQTRQSSNIIAGTSANAPKIPTKHHPVDPGQAPTVQIPKSNLFAHTSSASTNSNPTGGKGAVFDYNTRLVEQNVGWIVPAVNFGQSVYFDAVALALSNGDPNAVMSSQADLFGDLSNLTILQVIGNLSIRKRTSIAPRVGKYMLGYTDLLQHAGRLGVPVDITRFTVSCQDRLMLYKTTTDANKFANLGMYPTDNHLFGAAYIGFNQYVAIYNAKKSDLVGETLVRAGFSITHIPAIDNLTNSKFLTYCYRVISNAKVTVGNNKTLIRTTLKIKEILGSKANIRTPDSVLHQPLHVTGNSNVFVTETTIDGIQFYAGSNLLALTAGYGGGSLVGNSITSNSDFYTYLNQQRYYQNAETQVAYIFGDVAVNFAGVPAFTTGTGTDLGVSINTAGTTNPTNGPIQTTSNTYPKSGRTSTSGTSSGGTSSGSSSTSIGTSLSGSQTSSQPPQTSVPISSTNTVNNTGANAPTYSGTNSGTASGYAIDGGATAGIIQGESAGQIVWNYNGATIYSQYNSGAKLPSPEGLTVSQIQYYQSQINAAVAQWQIDHPGQSSNASSAVGYTQNIKSSFAAITLSLGYSGDTVMTADKFYAVANSTVIEYAKSYASSAGIPVASVTAEQVSMAVSYGPGTAVKIINYIETHPNGTWGDLVLAGIVSKAAANNNPAIAKYDPVHGINTPLSQVIPNANELHNLTGQNGNVSPTAPAIKTSNVTGQSGNIAVTDIRVTTATQFLQSNAPPGIQVDTTTIAKVIQGIVSESTLTQTLLFLAAESGGKINETDLARLLNVMADAAKLAYDATKYPSLKAEIQAAIQAAKDAGQIIITGGNISLGTAPGNTINVGGYKFVVQQDGSLRQVDPNTTYAPPTPSGNTVVTAQKTQSSSTTSGSTVQSISTNSGSGLVGGSFSGTSYTSYSTTSTTSSSKPASSTVSTGCTKPTTSCVSVSGSTTTSTTTTKTSTSSTTTSGSTVSSGSTLSYYMYGY